MQDHITKRRLRILRFLGWTTLAIAALIAATIVIWMRGCYSETECPSSDPKITALYKANNRLNKAFAHHDWEEIRAMEELTFRAGISGEPYSPQIYSQELRDTYGPGILGLRMISYKVFQDTAETANYKTGTLIFWPFYTFSDTAFHRWVYRDDTWYLVDWDRSNMSVGEYTPEQKELLRKAFPEDSAKWR
jgi:hypothetical protein